jgi:hypothetical protein
VLAGCKNSPVADVGGMDNHGTLTIDRWSFA